MTNDEKKQAIAEEILKVQGSLLSIKETFQAIRGDQEISKLDYLKTCALLTGVDGTLSAITNTLKFAKPSKPDLKKLMSTLTELKTGIEMEIGELEIEEEIDRRMDPSNN